VTPETATLMRHFRIRTKTVSPRIPRVERHAVINLDGIAAIAGPLAVHAAKQGMDANLPALKTILER
jgi:hypothetical protein